MGDRTAAKTTTGKAAPQAAAAGTPKTDDGGTKAAKPGAKPGDGDGKLAELGATAAAVGAKAAKLKIKYRPVDSLVPYARNARTHSAAQVSQLAGSIREFGFTNPVLLDGAEGILAGHGRVLAAQALGFKQVPTIDLAHLTPAQRRAYVIADNQLALKAGWNEELLALALGELNELDYDLAVIGFSDAELARALEAGRQTKGQTDPDAMPPKRATVISRTGDIWRCGRHRIVCGDATSADDWAALEVERPSLVFTSPPYGVGDGARLRDHYVPGRATRKSLYRTSDDDPKKWLELMGVWTELALKACDCVVCNVQMLAANKRHMVQWLADFSDHLVDVVVWDKKSGPPQMHENILTNAFEWIFILSNKPDASRAIPLGNFHAIESNIVRVSPQQKFLADDHGAVMPVSLAQWIIDVIGARAISIIDPFLGAGTTMIAAEIAGRACSGLEIDPAYVDTAVERWQTFAGEAATLDSSGHTFNEVARERRPEGGRDARTEKGEPESGGSAGEPDDGDRGRGQTAAADAAADA